MRRSCLLWVVACLGFGLSVPSLHAQPRLDKVSLAIPAISVSYMPMRIAQERGYYAEEGLDTQMLQMTAAIALRAAVAGSVEFTASAGTAIDAAVSGVKVKVILAIGDRALFDVIAQPEYKSIKDLKGKVVGTTSAGSLNDILTRDYLSKRGLQPDRDVILMVVGQPAVQLAALKARSIAAALLPAPFNFRGEEAGLVNLGFVGDEVKSITAGVALTERRYRQETQRVARFIKGTLKGFLFYKDHREASLAILKGFLGIDRPQLAQQVYRYHTAGLTKDGTISEALMVDLIDQARRVAKVGREIPPSEVFDFSLVRRASEELRAAGWKP